MNPLTARLIGRNKIPVWRRSILFAVLLGLALTAAHTYALLQGFVLSPTAISLILTSFITILAIPILIFFHAVRLTTAEAHASLYELVCVSPMQGINMALAYMFATLVQRRLLVSVLLAAMPVCVLGIMHLHIEIVYIIGCVDSGMCLVYDLPLGQWWQSLGNVPYFACITLCLALWAWGMVLLAAITGVWWGVRMRRRGWTTGFGAGLFFMASAITLTLYTSQSSIPLPNLTLWLAYTALPYALAYAVIRGADRWVRHTP
jgi:hypothetical protein